MEIAVVVLSLVLAASSLFGGFSKIAGTAAMRADAQRFGFSHPVYRTIGALELCASAGLVAGLFFWPLRLAAALGLAALTVGAVIVHLKAKDPVAKASGAGVVVVLALVTAALQTLAVS